MTLEVLQVDAFTRRAFGGNPDAVCFLEKPRPSEWMQALAAEMNLSETAYLRCDGDRYELRWFTPTVEVDLCGHATLASAHALWETGRLSPTEIARFQTRSGELSARLGQHGIELDFPNAAPSLAKAPAGLAEALGVVPAWLGTNRENYLALVESEAALRALTPDFAALTQLSDKGYIVTAKGTGKVDFVSRYFAPNFGIDEDPVTGSAHCALAPFWAERLGRNPLRAHQASPRGGDLEVEVSGERVLLRGQAITVWSGHLSGAAS